jgi:Rap1a immunity proteins
MSARTTAASLFGATLALNFTTAAAQDTGSANYISPGCQDFLNLKQPPTDVQGFCAGTVAGISFVGKDLRRLRPSYPSESDAVTSLHCLDIPEKVTLMQLVRGVLAYIEARPPRMHESFNDLALEALRAWPCR